MANDHQPAYRRWELASFGDERPSTVARRAAEEQAQATQLLNLPTEQELSEIRENARIEGYHEGLAAGHAEGHAAGTAAGQAEVAEQAARLRAVADSFDTATSGVGEVVGAELLELALHLAHGMLRTALEVKPELVLPVVREALDYLPTVQRPAMLTLHPDDLPLVRAALTEELDKGGWRLVADESIARGGCKVETASNQIDATVETRWARLAQALGGRLDWLG